LLKYVFSDTCVYHLPGIELLLKVIPIENILFGSEMVGAVCGVRVAVSRRNRYKARCLGE
jgi:4-oxalmesaconate hydratase